jgi:nucleoid-associated protein YgaU
MTDQGDRPPGPEEEPAEVGNRRSDVGAPSPHEADALLLENLSPFMDQRGPAPHDPPSASDTASWRYDDHGMPKRPRRRGRIVLRIVAPIAFLVLVVALVTVVLESGVMKKGSSSSPSASASSTAGTAWLLYKVKKGDTLSGIASKKHTNTPAILDLNPGLNENSLSVGQKIKVPKPAPSQ